MSKNKNQQDKTDSKVTSQLPIDFNLNGEGSTVDKKTTSAKVVSIRAITEQKKMNLVMDIIRNTKSF